MTMFYSMDEQASHLARLMEDNRKYIQENSRLKKGRSRGGDPVDSSDPYSNNNLYNNGVYTDNSATTELEDRVMALQLQNSELGLCLEREKRKRREAETRLERNEGYIKRLEDNVQTLNGSRVVMDPTTYRQVAEAYIAAKRTPARRPHTHNGVPGSDLVCDGPHNNLGDSQRRLPSHPAVHQTSSCPSSPSSCPSPPNSRRMYPTINSEEYPLYPQDFTRGHHNKNNNNKKDCGLTPQDLGRGLAVGGNPMNPWDYQELLKSLEDLDGGSRGPLS